MSTSLSSHRMLLVGCLLPLCSRGRQLVRMVVVVQRSSWGMVPASLLPFLLLGWSSASLALGRPLACGDWVGIFIRLQIPLGILKWFLDLPLIVWVSHAGFLLPESFG